MCSRIRLRKHAFQLKAEKLNMETTQRAQVLEHDEHSQRTLQQGEIMRGALKSKPDVKAIKTMEQLQRHINGKLVEEAFGIEHDEHPQRTLQQGKVMRGRLKSKPDVKAIKTMKQLQRHINDKLVEEAFGKNESSSAPSKQPQGEPSTTPKGTERQCGRSICAAFRMRFPPSFASRRRAPRVVPSFS